MDRMKRFALILLCFVAVGLCFSRDAAVKAQDIFYSEEPTEVAEHIWKETYFDPFKFQQLLCTPHMSCNESGIAANQSHRGVCCTCDCTHDCGAIGNCCYDMERPSPYQHTAGKALTKDGELCIKPSITGGDAKVWSKSYLLVKTCSTNYMGDAANKCLSNQRHSEDYLTPVYSEFTKIHYANVYCALCNFQTLTTPWKLYLQCESLQNVNDALTISGNISSVLQKFQSSERCALTWKSAYENEKRCFLENDIVSECDMAAKFYELKLSNLCKQEPFIAFESHLYMYKNVYCFLCHEQDTNQGFYNCLTGTMFELVFVPFTALINVRTLQPGSMAESSRENQHFIKCTNGLTYSKVLNKCVNETCAPSRVKKATTCLAVMETVESVALEYRFKLTYANKTIKEGEIYENALNIILGNTSLFECEFGITNITRNDNFETIAHVTSKRTVIYANNPFEEFDGYKRRILKSRENIYFRADLDESLLKPLPIDTINFLSFSDRNGSSKCGDTIAMHELQFCDTISLAADEFEVVNANLVVGSLTFSPSEFVLRPFSNGQKGFAQICKNLYISAAFLNKLNDKEDAEITDSREINQKQLEHSYSYPKFYKSVSPVSILTAVCIFSSMLSLIILIGVYILLQQTRTVPSLNTIMLAGSLLFSQCLFEFGIGQNDVKWLCRSIGVMIHYFWLAYMFWTNASSFHLFHTFVISHWSTDDCSRMRFVKYCLYCYISPAFFIGVNILFSFLKYGQIGYGDSLCYISTPLMVGVTFALPLGLLAISNSVFFIIVVFKLKITGVQIATRYSSAKRKCSDLNIYLRMSTLTGVTWLSGFVFVWTEVKWLEYVFILLNASHGVFLMLSFLANRRIYGMVKAKVVTVFKGT